MSQIDPKSNAPSRIQEKLARRFQLCSLRTRAQDRAKCWEKQLTTKNANNKKTKVRLLTDVWYHRYIYFQWSEADNRLYWEANQCGGSTVDGVFSGCGTDRITLTLEDGWEEVILNLWNVFYLLNSLCNLVSLRLLNDANIFYDNENHILYNKISRRPLNFIQRWKRSFFLYPLNLLVLATNLLKIEDVYQEVEPKIYLI